jgi:hypothetical protein
MWSDQMEPQQLEGIINALLPLHKSIQNIINIVFATSPLLALATHGWAAHNYHCTYLYRVSNIFDIFWSFINDHEDLRCPWE